MNFSPSANTLGGFPSGILYVRNLPPTRASARALCVCVCVVCVGAPLADGLEGARQEPLHVRDVVQHLGPDRGGGCQARC